MRSNVTTEARKPVRAALYAFSLGLCLFVAAGCTRSDPEEGADRAEGAASEEALPVETTLVRLQEVVETVRGESTLEAERSVQIPAEINGTVDAIYVDVGDRLERGERMAKLTNPDLQLQIAQARENLAYQERQVESVEPLFEEGYLARQQWDDLNFSLEQARNALARLRVQASEETVRAPFAGVVLERAIEPGQVVALGNPLFRVADPASLIVQIDVPERRLRALREGQPATLTFPALDGATVPASLRRLNPSVDAASGTIRVELLLSATSLDDGTPLRPGMYVTTRIETARRQSVPVLPRAAIIEEGGRTTVFVVPRAADEDGESRDDQGDLPEGAAQPAESYAVQERVVQLGWEGEGLVEIVEGVEVGDEVVSVGQSRLRDGTRVRVVGDEAAQP